MGKTQHLVAGPVKTQQHSGGSYEARDTILSGWGYDAWGIDISPENAAFIAAAGSTDFAALVAERDRLREAADALAAQARLVFERRKFDPDEGSLYDLILDLEQRRQTYAALAPGTPVDR